MQIDGVWWRSDQVEDKVPGTLEASFEEVRLQLAGTFDARFLKPGGRYPLVYGAGQGKLVTLYECESVGTTAALPGDVRERLDVRRGLIGAHLASPMVAQARLEYEHLTNWSGVAPVEVTPVTIDEREGLRLQHLVFPALAAVIVGLHVELEWAFYAGPGDAGPDVEHTYLLRRWSRFLIRTQEPVELARIDEAGGWLQSFVTLATGRSNALTGLWIRPPASDADAERRGRLWLQMFYPAIVKASAAVLKYDEPFLRVADIADRFDDALQRWAQTCRGPLRRGCNLYFGGIYHPARYLNQRFLELCQAAELIHRGLAGPSRITLHERILRLSATTPPAARRVLGNMDQLAAAIAVARNKEMHSPSDLISALRPIQLYLLTEQLRLIVHCTLMRQLGLDDVALDRALRGNNLIAQIEFMRVKADEL
jgi:hypothetical protein